MNNKEKYQHFPYTKKRAKKRHAKASTRHHSFAVFVLFCILIFLVFYIQKNFTLAIESLQLTNVSTDVQETSNTEQNITSFTLEESIEKASHANINFSVYSQAAILMDASSGNVLYSKNALDKMYPASTTKIMTAILTLENCTLDEIATVSKNATIIPPTYTHASLREGEQISIKDLLYTLMIASANDSAIVLAEYIAGSVENFSVMMNQKSAELGCVNTNFVNPNGIHDENHYSCAYDLALIGKYAMQNETFREIVKCTTYALPANEALGIDTRYFRTTNDLIREASNYYYPYCTGIKTGYTNPAKNCIVTSAQKDGLELIVTILGGEQTPDGTSARNTDCIHLFDYGFDNYSMRTICFANSTVQSIHIKNATPETKNLNLIAKDELTVLIPNTTGVTTTEPIIELQQDLKAPIHAGDTVGKVSYNIEGTIYTSDLIAGSDVEVASSLFTYLSMIAVVIILLFIYKLTKK